MIARDIVGSTINLGEIRDTTITSINAMPTGDDTADQLKPLLEKLTELLSGAVEEGVDEQVAADALDDVKTIADAVDEKMLQEKMPGIEARSWELVAMNNQAPANDGKKTKAQLIQELESLREQVAAL